MKYKKTIYLVLLLIMYIPFIVNAESCDLSSIIIDSIELRNTSGSAEELSNPTVSGKKINLDLKFYEPGDSVEYNLKVKNTSNEDFYFDEESGQFTGQVVEGVQALKGWIYFALRIARYKYPIFSWKYGTELETFIGQSFDDEDYLLSEVKRMIEDALLINPHIKSVEDVEVDYKNEKLEIKCMVRTKYGDIYAKI